MFYVGGAAVNGLMRGVTLLPRAIVWWVNAAQEGADFWSIAGRMGGAIGQALGASQVTWWVVAIEIVGVAALYGLQWLMRDEEKKQ